MRQVTAPVTTGMVYRSDIGSTKRLTLKHRERMLTVSSTGPDYGVDAIFINPLNPRLTTWLSMVSSLFETYKFTQLEFEYVPQCPTNTAGNVGAYVDLDPRDSSAPDYNSATAQPFCMTTPAWQSASFNMIDVLRRASSTQPLGANFRYCDFKGNGWSDPMNTMGTFHPFAQGLSTGVVGSWWVKYAIELAIPNLEATSYEKMYSVSMLPTNATTRRNPLVMLSDAVRQQVAACGLVAYAGDVTSAAHSGKIHLSILPFTKLSLTLLTHTANAAVHTLQPRDVVWSAEPGLDISRFPDWWGVNQAGDWSEGRLIMTNNTSSTKSASFSMAELPATYFHGPWYDPDEFDAFATNITMYLEPLLYGLSSLVPLSIPDPIMQTFGVDDLESVEIEEYQEVVPSLTLLPPRSSSLPKSRNVKL